jgi:hypothetical protein
VAAHRRSAPDTSDGRIPARSRPSVETVTGIFINYRSDDAVFAASLIDERIRQVFGDESVFLDCRSLHGGTDFAPELWRRLLSSTVLLVLIGAQWLTLTDESGEPRIKNPDDFVRKEIRTAFENGLWVVPVLLQETKLPRAASLPEDIRGLNTRQYVHLRGRHAKNDLDHLVREIERIVPPLALPPTALPAPPARNSQQIGGSVGNIFNGKTEVGRDIVGGNKTGKGDRD